MTVGSANAWADTSVVSSPAPCRIVAIVSGAAGTRRPAIRARIGWRPCPERGPRENCVRPLPSNDFASAPATKVQLSNQAVPWA